MDFESCKVHKVGGVGVRQVWQSDHGCNGRVEELKRRNCEMAGRLTGEFVGLPRNVLLYHSKCWGGGSWNMHGIELMIIISVKVWVTQRSKINISHGMVRLCVAKRPR